MTAKAPGEWHYYDVDLRAYQGQDIYVAIVHFDCSNQFMLNIDDIMLYRTYNAVAENNAERVSVYPNPVTDVLSVESGNSVDCYEIYTMAGAMVSHQTVGSRAFSVDVNKLPAGVYFINIYANGQKQTCRFVKQ